MFNKKATGIKWDILLFSLFSCIVIIMIVELTDKPIPSVGEYSSSMIKEFEKNSITPAIIKTFLEKTNEVSVGDLKELEVFLGQFENYCGGAYEVSLETEGRYFRTGDYGGNYGTVHCPVNEEYLKKDFSMIFDRNYGAFIAGFSLLYEPDVGPKVIYSIYSINSNPFQKKDDTYFDIVVPSSNPKLTIPITVGSGTGKNIGGFIMDPSFKLPILDSSSVSYDFGVDNTARERCIFSAGCTKCQEVIDRYPGAGYKKMKVGCEEYKDPETRDNNCWDVKDTLGKTYNRECNGGELCQGTCTPYCSSPYLTEDTTSNTNCRQEECINYHYCEVVEGNPDSCYCPDNENACDGVCLPYCSDSPPPPPDKIEDGNPNTNCKENSCDSYVKCDHTSSCACSSESDYGCDGACIPYCSSDDPSKTVDADTNTNCQSNHCSSIIYVPGTCESILDASACYCPMSYFECYGACELCDYGVWADAGGGCGEGACLDTQILQQKVSTNGCDTKTQCVDRTSCDCRLDGVANTECLDYPCISYDLCTTASSCGCSTGNACDGECILADIKSITTVIDEVGGRVDWSHKHDMIAFGMIGADGYYDLYTMNPDFSNKICLTCDKQGVPQKHNGQPAWHPDGEWIVFQAQDPSLGALPDLGPLKENLGQGGAGVNNNLWLTNKEGTEFYQLTHIVQYEAILHPHFSHDGSKLFWAERERQGIVGGEWALKIADFSFDGNGEPQLTSEQTYRPMATDDTFYESHEFTKDDEKVIFSADIGRENRYYDLDIWEMNIATQQMTRLTDTEIVWDEHAILSPSGEKIVWVSSLDYTWDPSDSTTLKTDFWIMDRDGLNKKKLTYFNDPDHTDYIPGGNIVAADSSWNKEGTKLIAHIKVAGKVRIIMIEFYEQQ